jgi:peptidyl-prolyl cis-trans isomerase C
MSVSKLLKEPLFRFLVIGAALFALSAWHQARRPASGADAPPRIQVTAATIERLREEWGRRFQRPPTAEELHGLVEQHIREEVLYREALALGLDQDDTVVRRRLVQKMEFLSEDIAQAEVPDEAALQQYFERNAERYARPTKVSFRHVYFSRERRGERAVNDAREALLALVKPGASDEAFGDPFLQDFELTDIAEADIAAMFGREFASQVMALPVDEWRGPVASSYGVHLVRVSGRTAPQRVKLADVRAAVVRDYQDARRREANRAVFERLRQRYQIVVDEAAMTAAAAEPINTAQAAR